MPLSGKTACHAHYGDRVQARIEHDLLDVDNLGCRHQGWGTGSYGDRQGPMVRMLKRVSNPNVSRVRRTTSALGVATVAGRAAKRRQKNKAAVALGKLGGRKGGLTRAKNLTAAERSAIAKKAAHARWNGRKKRKK
jgi:hypothetical protein